MIPGVSIAGRRALEAYWLERMRAHVADLATRSPWYRERLNGFNVDGPQEWEDLLALPLTTKDEFARHNEQFLAVPSTQVVDHTSTSGSTGEPVPFLLTENDLRRLAENEALSLATAGITRSDTVQITTTLDRRFMAGLAYWLGLRRIGAGVVRSGPGDPRGQWDLMLASGTTALIAVPSFLLRLLHEWHRTGLDPRRTSVRRVVCIGEPIGDGQGGPNLLARRILDRWDIALHGTYASTEMATAFTEPIPFQGHRVPHQLALTEVLDDEGRPVPEGVVGELTATPFGVEGMPLLRYRTGDMCVWSGHQDIVGHYTMMLGPVVGRKEQRMKVKGTTLYPQQVIDALNGEETVRRFVVLREKDELGLDTVHVLVDADPSTLERSAERLRHRLRVLPILEVADPAHIERLIQDPHKRKTSLFIDRGENNDQLRRP